MQRSRPVGRTNLKRRKDTPILIKQNNLNRVIADPRRDSFENWLVALGRAKTLRLLGYDVTLPPLTLAALNFLLSKTPRCNTRTVPDDAFDRPASRRQLAGALTRRAPERYKLPHIYV